MTLSTAIATEPTIFWKVKKKGRAYSTRLWGNSTGGFSYCFFSRLTSIRAGEEFPSRSFCLDVMNEKLKESTTTAAQAAEYERIKLLAETYRSGRRLDPVHPSRQTNKQSSDVILSLGFAQ